MKSSGKKIKRSVIIVFTAFCSLILVLNVSSKPQIIKKAKVAILQIDTKGLNIDPEQMGNIVRLELSKLDTFEVMDKYDVAYMIEKNNLKITNCYGKICLVDIGKVLKADKMVSGSVELFGESIVISLNLIDVASESIEKTSVKEFLNLPKEIQFMIRMTLNTMFNIKNDEFAVYSLTKKNNYESSVNNPNATRLNLSGSRWGAIYYTGNAASRLKESTKTGGYGMYNVMFQFGYQFEIQYLNEGNFQALFEIIPLISGLDQGRINPSLTIMNGLRNNKNGLEFGFGPTLGITRKAVGYYDSDNQWHLENEWTSNEPNIYQLENREDSRGSVSLNPGFIFAIGKSFKSGKLNIPVNVYVIPNKNGVLFGASFGFNAKKNSIK